MQKEKLSTTGSLRNQSYIEVLANYFSKNPQPQLISKENEFFNLYPNFDFDFYRSYYRLETHSDLYIFNHYHTYHKYHKPVVSDILKIVFYVPPPNNNIGGINAMYRLSQAIANMGYKNIRSYIYVYDHTKYPNRYNNNYVHPFEIDENTIVVYPETISHNPLDAKNVIRWVLLDLGYEMPSDHYKKWNKDDIVYFWEPKDKGKQLSIPWIDSMLFDYVIDNSYRTDESCYMLRKYQDVNSIKSYTTMHHPKEAKQLDKLSHSSILIEFIKNKYFYSYDPNTFYNLIAPLCGCVTILHPIPGVTKEEYLNSRITKGFTSDSSYSAGIAYGYSDIEIQKAIETVPLAKDQILKMIKSYEVTVLNMLEDVHSLIYKNKKLPNTVEEIYYK